MDDRGENIVNLAKALLQNESDDEHRPANAARTGELPLKALCLTALLSAFGSSAVTCWMHENYRPINHYEKVKLDALVYYAALQNQQDEFHLRQKVQTQLALPSMDSMTAQDFARTRDYLRSIIP